MEHGTPENNEGPDNPQQGNLKAPMPNKESTELMIESRRRTVTGVAPKVALRNLVSRISGRSRLVYGTVVHDLDGFPLHSDLSSMHAEAVAASIASILDDIEDVVHAIAEEEVVSARIELTESEIEVVPNLSKGICLVAMKSRDSSDDSSAQPERKATSRPGTVLFDR